MKVSGCTIVRNGVKLQYPVVESIHSILPLCDEFIVNVGKSDDDTLALVRGIRSPKLKIVKTVWDFSNKEKVLSEQTNIALSHCTGDWVFYLQSDEVVHESDLPRLKRCMEGCLDDPSIDALRFKWFHFYGSHYRYRIDRGWYQKQDRIIRNNGKIESYGDAFAFRRWDGQDLRTKDTGCFIYHYGWVFTPEMMARRRINSGEIWGDERAREKKTGRYEFGDPWRFPVYFGTHPAVMRDLVLQNPISREDWRQISRRHWWNPLWWLHMRYKTGRRIKYPIMD
jgi:glycosyltransferase involved in cell wall biosynthesis